MLDHRGQSEAWAAKTRKLIVLAGWQAGKTDFLVWWCLRQLRRGGPGEAIVAAPSHPLLMAATQPRLVRAIEERGLGEHKKGDRLILVPYDALRRCGYEGDDRGDLTIFLKHTQEAKDVEAVTARWFAGDEVGQMKDEVLEAVEGRTSATGGDVCLISRPYFDNKFRDLAENPDHETTVVSFASWENPGWRPDLRAVPGALEAEIERLRSPKSMPLWRFWMKYGGQFTRPAGAILDNWTDSCEVDPFLIPATWKRYAFVDFGPVHTFVTCVAESPTEKDSEGYPVLYAYREHFPNQARVAFQHVRELKAYDKADFDQWAKETGEEAPIWHVRGIGGAASEDEWRREWSAAGLSVERPAVSGIEPQIDRLYACVGRGGFKVFKTCRTLIKQLKAWSWEVDDAGEPIPGKVKDDVHFHGPASVRYGISQLRPTNKEAKDEPEGYPIGSRGWLNEQRKQRDPGGHGAY